MFSENKSYEGNAQYLEQEKASFDENGYIGPFTLYSPEEMKKIWTETRIKLLDKKNAVYPENKMNYDRHLDVDFIDKVIRNPKIVQRVQKILGENLICWRTEWFPKYYKDEGTIWHQAQNFRTFGGEPKLVPTKERSGPFEITVWVAFTDSMKEMGCMKVIPKTHKQMYFDENKDAEFDPKLDHKGTGAGFYGYDFNKIKIDPDWEPDESKAKYLEMKAGQFFIFTSRCIHGAEPNMTEGHTRMGLAIRYVPTDVKIYPNSDSYTQFGETFTLENYKAILVAGTDDYGHNRFLPASELTTESE